MGKDSVGEEESKCKYEAMGMGKAHYRECTGILTGIEDSHRGLS